MPAAHPRPAGVERLRIVAVIVAMTLFLAAAAAAQEDAPAPPPPADAPGTAPQGGGAPEAPPGDLPPDASPGEPPPEGVEAPPAPPALSVDNVVGAVDRTHGRVEDTLNRSVAWFDSFFSDRQFLEEGTPDSHFRLRTGVRFRERDAPTGLARFHASLVMPGAKRRLRLILEGKGDAQESVILPIDPTTPDFAGQTQQGSLQAAYEFIRRADVNISIRPGVRFRFPVDPFLKVRLRWTHLLGTKALIRLTEEGFVTVEEGFGETTRVDLERQLTPLTFLRWTTSGTLAETNTGYVWGSELSLFRQLTPRTAITVEGGVSGQVRPPAMTNYVTRVRFRQNIFRPWFFYEVEPELSWPRDENGAYPPTWGITLLVEFQFGRLKETRPEIPPPPAPAPSPPPAPAEGDGTGAGIAPPAPPWRSRGLRS